MGMLVRVGAEWHEWAGFHKGNFDRAVSAEMMKPEILFILEYLSISL